MQKLQTQRKTIGACALLAAIMTALAGCGHSADSSAPGSIPANGTPAEIQQSIQQNAARQSEAVKNMPAPGAQAPAANPPGGVQGTH